MNALSNNHSSPMSVAIARALELQVQALKLDPTWDCLLDGADMPLNSEAFVTCPGKPVATRFECNESDLDAALDAITTQSYERKSGEFPVANIPKGVDETLDWMKAHGIDPDKHVIGIVDGKAAGWIMEIESTSAQPVALAS